MSASRHTYVVVLETIAPEVSDVVNAEVICMMGDGTYGTGSRQVAEERRDELAKMFPDATYSVKQVR